MFAPFVGLVLRLRYQAIQPRHHEPFRVQVHPPSLGIALRVGPRTILSQQELMQQTQRCACAECSRKTGAGIAHGVEFVLGHARMSMEPWNGRGGFAPTVRRHVCSSGDMCAKEGDGREASTVFLVRSCADAMPNSMFEWNCTAPQSSTNTAW